MHSKTISLHQIYQWGLILLWFVVNVAVFLVSLNFRDILTGGVAMAILFGLGLPFIRKQLSGMHATIFHSVGLGIASSVVINGVVQFNFSHWVNPAVLLHLSPIYVLAFLVWFVLKGKVDNLLSAPREGPSDSMPARNVSQSRDSAIMSAVQLHQDLFLQQGFRLFDLSKAINLPPSVVSQAIKRQTGENFRDFINSYRIEVAKRRLCSESDRLTIEAIAQEVGFNSRTSFYQAFKKNTEQTPREFITETLSR